MNEPCVLSWGRTLLKCFVLWFVCFFKLKIVLFFEKLDQGRTVALQDKEIETIWPVFQETWL